MMAVKNKKSCIKEMLIFILLALVLLFTTSCLNAGLKVEAKDLTTDIEAKAVDGKAADSRLIDSMAGFSIGLFQKSVDDDENSLISPLSVMLALAMTANGADNETLTQIETVLGKDIPLDELNQYLYAYVNNLPSEDKSKLSIANSIWFRDDENRLTVEKDFLQQNADYYDADIYQAVFDESTVADINNWVKANTDDMIDQIINQIDYDTVMYLINAVAFDAEWQNVYNKENIREGNFTAIDGDAQQVEFMSSEESLYLEDGMATGFIKPYYDGQYSFVALLPDEDVALTDYIASLSGAGFIDLIKSAENTPVNAFLPKFSYDYSIKMNDALSDLGMPDGFSAQKADFTKLGRSSRGNIYIGEVLHKTFIAVDELGTRAGAVTEVEMKDEDYMETKTVKLDRPFVYAIVDNSTALPIFIGVVKDLL